GLNFTSRVIDALKDTGINCEELTLHV
ncbi:hypothetical protein EZS27_024497, partial [termite gut metagenome]